MPKKTPAPLQKRVPLGDPLPDDPAALDAELSPEALQAFAAGEGATWVARNSGGPVRLDALLAAKEEDAPQ